MPNHVHHGREALRKAVKGAAFAIMLTTAVVGCTGGDKSAEGSGSASFPVTVKASNGDVVVNARPTRIVSLSPSATENLFAVGAGEQVVAVDDQSNYPANAPKSNLSGFTPNSEAIIAQRPDLVVISNDSNGLTAAMTAAKIPVLSLPAPQKLDELYDQIADVGAATGHADTAANLIKETKSEIAESVAKAPKAAQGRTYFHELDNTYYTVSSKTFAGELYGLFGLRNVADTADKSGSGYPQMSAEGVIAANPDYIFLADTKCCGQSPQTVAARPGFAQLSAVKSGHVVALDDDVASRWGPRVIDFVKAISDALSRP